jgi:hypothetical protein
LVRIPTKEQYTNRQASSGLSLELSSPQVGSGIMNVLVGLYTLFVCATEPTCATPYGLVPSISKEQCLKLLWESRANGSSQWLICASRSGEEVISTHGLHIHRDQ